MNVVRSRYYVPSYNYYSRTVYVTTNEEYLKLKSLVKSYGCEMAFLSRSYRKVNYEIFGSTLKKVEAVRRRYFNYLKK